MAACGLTPLFAETIIEKRLPWFPVAFDDTTDDTTEDELLCNPQNLTTFMRTHSLEQKRSRLQSLSLFYTLDRLLLLPIKSIQD